MVKNRCLLFSVFMTLIMCSCTQTYDDGISSLITCKKSFIELYNRSDLFDHFPEYDRENPLQGRFTQLIPTSRRGKMFQYEYYDKDRKNVERLKQFNVIYHSNYNDSNNIIIDFAGFRDSLIQRPESNRYFENKYPLPDLGFIDFNLGTTINNVIGADDETYDVSKFNYPEDLEVYVIDAKAGNFWKTKSDKKNPEALKAWKYGYSRGYAISESQQRIIYWTIVW